VTTPGFWAAEVAPGVVLTWTPPGRLSGNADLLDQVLDVLDGHEALLLTPTGPSIPATVEDRAAVFAVVVNLYPAAAFSGDVPDLEALWRDDVPPGDDVVFSPA